jgi:hypothetical protein
MMMIQVTSHSTTLETAEKGASYDREKELPYIECDIVTEYLEKLVSGTQ